MVFFENITKKKRITQLYALKFLCSKIKKASSLKAKSFWIFESQAMQKLHIICEF